MAATTNGYGCIDVQDILRGYLWTFLAGHEPLEYCLGAESFHPPSHMAST